MKKILAGILAFMFLATSVFAQSNQQPASKTTTQQHVKKNGTADKRFKENKQTTTAVQSTTHLKKNGTPDKRYKENKDVTTKKVTPLHKKTVAKKPAA